jgi:fibro-slime domain-containing protein
MKKQKIGQIISISILALTVVAMGGILGGFIGTAQEISATKEDNKVDVILASANINNSTNVSVPILYYDQEKDACLDIYNISMNEAVSNRQFEWSDCGYYNSEVEAGMVSSKLDDQYLPVATGGSLLENRGVNSENFKRWFNQVEGKSKSYAGTMNLSYNSETGSFEYKSENYYPLDDITMKSDEFGNRAHNHLFTLNLGVPFQALLNGREKFVISADDDTWVFVGDTLVLDMGGVHDTISGNFIINEDGEVYASVNGEDLAFTGVKLKSGESSIVRIFHADRNGISSEFNLDFVNMLLNITNTSIASENGGVEVAYDPTNPSYIAPLGESLTVRPDNRKALMTMMVSQIVAMGALGSVIVMTISVAWRRSRRDRNQVK